MLAEMNRVESDNEILKTKYQCKELMTAIIFDPILCSELIDIVYTNLINNRSISLTKFAFHDVNKSIDLEFETKKQIDYNVIMNNIIFEVFKNFYRSLVFDNKNYLTMCNLNFRMTQVFKDVVINDIDSICCPSFQLFTPLLIGSDGNKWQIRLLLV